MELATLPPAVARPSLGEATIYDPPPAYVPNHETLPPTYQDVSQQPKDTPRRKRWFQNRILFGVVLTLMTAGIIASLAAVFTIQAKNRKNESVPAS